MTVTEGGSLTFTVVLDNAVAGAFDVDVSFTDGSASGGSDYANASATLSFLGNAGETQQFTVTTTNDSLVEGAEDFTVSLVASNILVDDSDTATGTISDDDTATISFDLVGSLVDEESVTAHLISVSLNVSGGGTLDRDVTVDVTDLLSGTATTGTDYTFATPQTLTFTAGSGSGSQTAELSTLSDLTIEILFETVNLSLTGLADGTAGQVSVGQDSHILRIDSDDVPQVSFVSATTSVAEGASPVVLVQLTTPDGLPIAVGRIF